MFPSKKDAEYFLGLCKGLICGKCRRGFEYHDIIPAKKRGYDGYEIVCD
jgi:hypothetical protein